MRKKRRGADEAEINMTPMLDIVFILLIFFIVTTSFVKEFGIDANRSFGDAGYNGKTVRDDICQDRRRWPDFHPQQGHRTFGLCTQISRATWPQSPDAAVVIAAGRNANAGLLVRVVDQARVAGASRISMVATKE